MKINRSRLLKITEDLINIYSPSGKEAQIVDFIEDLLSKHGIASIRQNVTEKRDNLLVQPEVEPRQVVFVGHVDTVAAFSLEEYKAQTEDEKLIGLGACDMKSGCAAMIEAFISYKEEYKKLPPASLAFVVGEEENGDGASRLCEDYFYEYAIIGEPTSMNLALSHFGYLEMAVTTIGIRKHASMVNYTKNAVHEMLSALNTITRFLDIQCKGCVYNLRDVSSSNAGFVVAERCEAWIDIHVPPLYTVQHIAEKIKTMISNHFTESKKEISYDFPTMHTGYSLQNEGIVPDILASLCDNSDTTSFPSDSDGALLWQSGIKPVIIGPGSLAVAHTQEEFVFIQEVIQAAEVYYGFLETFSKTVKSEKAR
ncbi:MAG: M20/M25/M40 family metallo-hydrolase [Spirochaetes bacterium]|jgi:acetylornithine deacetylase|nr:M20/M25/M40 family metallo-hydrolase [Spirochaetota bacterium]